MLSYPVFFCVFVMPDPSVENRKLYDKEKKRDSSLSFERSHSNANEFHQQLLAKNVNYFEIVQDVNCMGHVYRRCFYTRKDKANENLIFVEVPMGNPYIQWTTSTEVMIKDHSLWNSILDNFKCGRSRCCLFGYHSLSNQ